jgi:predicted RNA-binding Zn ribbon-like protein
LKWWLHYTGNYLTCQVVFDGYNCYLSKKDPVVAETEKYVRTIDRFDGWLCLDFANTVEEHASDHPIDELQSYADLVAWAEVKGILTGEEAALLLREAAARPAEAAAVLQRAIALREEIWRIFAAIARGRAPDPTDLTALNVTLAEEVGNFQIVASEGGFYWDWKRGEGKLDSMLGVIVRSAANLLTDEDLARVGQCRDERGCGWLFLDTSRNHSRRWCSMEGCGNRAKARQHYKRQQLDE